TLRDYVLANPMFCALTGKPPPENKAFNVADCKKLFYDGLKHTNTTVFEAPKKGIGKRGMGCTAEVIYVDGHDLVVGHVGDSRVYHLSQGNLVQVTRDQTLVNRLVELGQLTEAEAETHPRKNE